MGGDVNALFVWIEFATDCSAMDVKTHLQSLAVQILLWRFQEAVGHPTELSEEGAAVACCFEMERDTELRVVQGLGNERVETPQRNGDIVQLVVRSLETE